jgi:hypothetical protein
MLLCERVFDCLLFNVRPNDATHHLLTSKTKQVSPFRELKYTQEIPSFPLPLPPHDAQPRSSLKAEPFSMATTREDIAPQVQIQDLCVCH